MMASIATACHTEVVTVTLDLGQDGDLEEIRDRALAAGAVRAHVLDVREEFARDYVLPSLHARALHDGRDPMVSELVRPLVEKKLREIADIEEATGVVESFDTAASLWGRVGSAITPIPSAAGAPEVPAHVEVEFERGIPIGVNGVPLRLLELIESMAVIAAQHGVGRLERSDAPAAVVLHTAHSALETFVLSPDLAALKESLGVAYADIVRRGLWWTPMREALDAFNAKVQEQVTGSVRIQLSKGKYTILECKSPVARGRVAAARVDVPAAAAVRPS